MAFLVGVAEVWSGRGVVHCDLRLSEGAASANWGMHMCYRHAYIMSVYRDVPEGVIHEFGKTTL